MLNIPFINFWIDLNDLFSKIENECIDFSIIFGKLVINILDKNNIEVLDIENNKSIKFTKLDNTIRVIDKIYSKEYTIQNVNGLLKDIKKSLFEFNTESDVLAFLKLCSNDTNFLKIREVPYPEIFSLPNKVISLLEEYF